MSCPSRTHRAACCFVGSILVLALAFAPCPIGQAPAPAEEMDDPFLWLEEVDGPAALDWVRAHNDATAARLEAEEPFQPIRERIRAIMDSPERIPRPRLLGDLVYNFWQDEQHPRGIWRRMPLAAYLAEGSDWETVLDIDALAAADGVPWTYKGADFLPPEHRLCLVSLSPGGGDAVVVREFDTHAKEFVAGGFMVPEAKSEVKWRDEDHLWVGTDFGPGSLTTCGYPGWVALWERGAPLAEAPVVFRGEATDAYVSAASHFEAGRRHDLIERFIGFYHQQRFLWRDGTLIALDLPGDANFYGFLSDWMLLEPRAAWTTGGTTYAAGSLLAIDLERLLRGDPDVAVLFAPGERSALSFATTTRDRVVAILLDNVRNRIVTFTPGEGGWIDDEISLPGLGSVWVHDTSHETDRFFFTYEDFLTPTSLFFVESGRAQLVKAEPAFFDSDGMTVEQGHAVASDSTQIPYFLVTPRDFPRDGSGPVLLSGYGGFQVPSMPLYSAALGAAWLERGGAYAVANGRGGGEFGPAWHMTAIRENRMRSFQDFIAVAEDLIARGITGPQHLGIEGGSQGGLLVATAFTLRPELFNAVISAVPLADMRRYSHLLAGASWMDEYGDPDDPADWSYIRTWSAYHLLRADASYPAPFFWTNTRDDRVHPAHARKMAARMEAMGHPVVYFENIEGGHGGGATHEQKAYTDALSYTYLWTRLK